MFLSVEVGKKVNILTHFLKLYIQLTLCMRGFHSCGFSQSQLLNPRIWTVDCISSPLTEGT